MKKTIFSLVFVITTIYSFSQKERNIWYFGDQAGMDFNSGSPVALTNGAMFTYDNCTSVADAATGNLLFYSNGVDVWNKNHALMPNGSGLLGNTTGGNSAFAVRQPGSTTKYYLFTNDAFAGPNGLRYSIIDISLNGGLGGVTATKNVLLLNPSTEKITAIKHSNGQDVWIVAHPWNSNTFNVFLLSSTGLNTTPVVSTIGSTHAGGTLGTYNAMGQISASSQGNKIIAAIYDLQQYELFDFDNNTGSLSNLISISGYPTAWGAEFSPDGTKLYTTCWQGSSSVHQFDLSSNNQNTINASATTVGNVSGAQSGYLQLAPDGKIYLAKFTNAYLGVINSPNSLGAACNYIDNGFFLAGKTSQAGLPSFMQTLKLAVTVNSAITCPGDCSTLIASPSSGTPPYSYLWSPGSQTVSSIIICPTATTTYSVIVNDALGSNAQGITTVTVNPSPSPSISGPIAVCTTSNNAFLTASGGNNYVWSTGATASSIAVAPTTTTTYSVTTANTFGCTASASFTVTVAPPPIAIATNATICQGQTAILSAFGGTSYSWSNGSSSSGISVNPTASITYTVIVFVGSCSDTTTANVIVNPAPIISAYSDTTITIGDTITLTASIASNYLWNNGDTTSTTIIFPHTTTIYCVKTINSYGCTDSSCITVNVKDIDCSLNATGPLFIPNAFSPNNDNENDFLNVQYGNFQCIKTFRIVIYNRWGEKIFESSDPKFKWSGSYQGEKQNTGVFTYYIKVTMVNDKEIERKGNISIIK